MLLSKPGAHAALCMLEASDGLEHDMHPALCGQRVGNEP